MIISVILVFAFLGSILITIIRNGWPAMSWDMITQLPGGGFYIGKEGGVLNAIVGSIYIVGASTILGLLISIPIVFFINIYLKNDSKLASITRLSFDVLYGIPSIVYGAFGFTIMIFLGLRTSLLGGIIVITLLIIPIFVRSMDEVARQLPKHLLEATYSLGATRYETIKVAIRQIAPGIATATLLSIGRAGRHVYRRIHRQHTYFSRPTGGNLTAGDLLPAEQSSARSSRTRLRRSPAAYAYRFGTEYRGAHDYSPFL